MDIGTYTHVGDHFAFTVAEIRARYCIPSFFSFEFTTSYYHIPSWRAVVDIHDCARRMPIDAV